MEQNAAIALGTVELVSQINLAGYKRDRAELIRDVNRFTPKLGQQISYGIEQGMGDRLARSVESSIIEGHLRAIRKISQMTSNQNFALGGIGGSSGAGGRSPKPEVLGASFGRPAQFADQGRSQGKAAGEEMGKGVAQGFAQAEPIIAAQFNKSISGAILATDFIKFGLRKAVDGALGTLPGQISQVVAGTLSGGGGLSQGINLQLETNTAVATLSALTTLDIGGATKQIQDLNDRLAKSAAALPGATEDYKRLASTLSDNVAGAFKDVNRNLDTEGYTDALAGISESFGALTASTTRDIGNTSLALTRALGGASSAELRNFAFFEQNATALNAISAKLAQTGVQSLADLTLEGRVKLLEGVGKSLITDDYKSLAENSVDGLLQSFRSRLFDPSTGIFGINRDIDTALEGTQSIFTSFNEVVRGLISENDEDMGLVFRMAEAAQRAGLQLGDPLANQKRVLDGIAGTIERLKGNTDAIFQSAGGQAFISVFNGIQGAIARITTDADSLKLAFTGVATVLGGPMGGALALVVTNAEQTLPMLQEIGGGLLGVFERLDPVLEMVSDRLLSIGERAMPIASGLLAGAGGLIEAGGAALSGQPMPQLAFAGGMPELPQFGNGFGGGLSMPQFGGGFGGFGGEEGAGGDGGAGMLSQVGVAGAALQPILENLKEIAFDVGSVIGNVISSLPAIAQSLAPITQTLTSIVAAISGGVAGAVEQITEILFESGKIVGVFETISTVVDALKPGVEALGGILGNLVGNAIALLDNDVISSGLVSIADLISKIAVGWEAIFDKFPILSKIIALVAAGAVIIPPIVAGVTAIGAGIISVGGAIAGAFALLNPVTLTIAGITTGVIGLGLLVKKFWPDIKSIAGGIKDDIGTALGNTRTSLSGLWSKTEGLRDRFGQVGDRIKGGTKTLGEMLGISNRLETPFKNLKKFAQDIKDGLKGAFSYLSSMEGPLGKLAQLLRMGRGNNSSGGAGRAVRSGLYTAPQSRNGGSSEYHIDTKIAHGTSTEMQVQIFDQLAAGYAEMGKEIEFSNAAVSGEIYRVTDSFKKKANLLKRAADAHSHSVSSAFDSFDYYIPDTGKGRNHRSAEGAEMLLPSIPGGQVEYGSGGRYGNYAIVTDQEGNVVYKQGHGDDGKGLPPNFSFVDSGGSQPSISSAQRTTVKVNPTGQTDSKGLEILRMDLVDADTGAILDSVFANSGDPSKQIFTEGESIYARPGGRSPIPTGTFPIEQATTSSNPGIDGWFVPLTGAGNNMQGRDLFGIHSDADRAIKPGSAGCLVLYEPGSEAKVKEWLANKNAPRELTVSYTQAPAMGDQVTGMSGGFDIGDYTGSSGGGGGRQQNLDKFFDAMSYLEANNDPKAYNTDSRGNIYASGAFQFTPITREDAAELGLQDPGDRSLSYEEQRRRAQEFAKVRDPKGYEAAASGNWKEAERQFRQRWTSLPGAAESTQSSQRYDKYYDILAAGGGGGSMPSLPDVRYDLPAESSQAIASNVSSAVADATESGMQAGAEAAMDDTDLSQFINPATQAQRALETAQTALKKKGELNAQARKEEDRAIAFEREKRKVTLQRDMSALAPEDSVGRALLEYEEKALAIDESMGDRVRTANRDLADLENARELKIRQMENLDKQRTAYEDALAKGLDTTITEDSLKKLEADITAVDYSAAIAEYEKYRDSLNELIAPQLETERNRLIQQMDAEVKKTRELIRATGALNNQYGDPTEFIKYQTQLESVGVSYEEQRKKLETQISSMDQLMKITELTAEQQVDLVTQRVKSAKALDNLNAAEERATEVLRKQYAERLKAQQLETVKAEMSDRARLAEATAVNIERYDPDGATAIRRQVAETELLLTEEIEGLKRIDEWTDEVEQLNAAIAEGNEEFLRYRAEIGRGSVEDINAAFEAQEARAGEFYAIQTEAIAQRFPTVAQQWRETIESSTGSGIERGLMQFTKDGNIGNLFQNIFGSISDGIISMAVKRASTAITGKLFEEDSFLDNLLGGSGEETEADIAADTLEGGGILAGEAILRSAQQAKNILAGSATEGAGGTGILSTISSKAADALGIPSLSGKEGNAGKGMFPGIKTFTDFFNPAQDEESGKAFGDGFKSTVDDSGEKLGKTAAKGIGGVLQQIMGSLGGMGGGEGGGWLGTVMSVVGSLFSDGGLIPSYATGGFAGLTSAMNKERSRSGKRPQLAIVHEKEYLIPARSAEKVERDRPGLLDSLRTGKIPTFAYGGRSPADSVQPVTPSYASVGMDGRMSVNPSAESRGPQRMNVAMEYVRIGDRDYVERSQVDSLQQQINSKATVQEAAQATLGQLLNDPGTRRRVLS